MTPEQEKFVQECEERWAAYEKIGQVNTEKDRHQVLLFRGNFVGATPRLLAIIRQQEAWIKRAAERLREVRQDVKDDFPRDAWDYWGIYDIDKLLDERRGE